MTDADRETIAQTETDHAQHLAEARSALDNLRELVTALGY